MQEAPFSLNTFLLTEKGYHVQITVRAKSAEELIENAETVLKLAVGRWEAVPKPVGRQEAVPEANEDNDKADFIEIEGGHIVLRFNDDGTRKALYLGGRYQKFGVRVWPEVLKTVGLSLDKLEQDKEYPVASVKVELTEDGKPRRVTEIY